MKSDAGTSECSFAGHFIMVAVILLVAEILSALTTVRVRHPQFASTISPALKPLFLLSKTLESRKICTLINDPLFYTNIACIQTVYYFHF